VLTAGSIVSSIASFIAEKTLGRVTSIPFDKRAKACRSLTKLYYAVLALEEVTASILEDAASFKSTEHGVAFGTMNALNNYMLKIEQASNLFIDLGFQLHAGLEIIDPALAKCCDMLYVSKFDFLSEMSKSVTWKRSKGSSRIIIKMPKRTVDPTALERAYADVLKEYHSGNKSYWPDTWVGAAKPAQIVLTWEDEAAATAFLSALTGHMRALSEARSRIRELLRSSFSIEELLFPVDTKPWST
jgi:hypothetical protein